MGYSEHHCVACGHEHAAALWYSRGLATGGKEYLCGEKHRNRTDQASWSLDPDSDSPMSRP